MTESSDWENAKGRNPIGWWRIAVAIIHYSNLKIDAKRWNIKCIQTLLTLFYPLSFCSVLPISCVVLSKVSFQLMFHRHLSQCQLCFMLTNNCQSVREREGKIVFYLKYFNCEVSIVWPGPTHFPNYLFLKSLFDSIQYSDIIRRDSINEYNLSEQFSIIPALCLYESAKDTLEILRNLDNCHLPLSLFVGFSGEACESVSHSWSSACLYYVFGFAGIFENIKLTI